MPRYQQRLGRGSAERNQQLPALATSREYNHRLDGASRHISSQPAARPGVLVDRYEFVEVLAVTGGVGAVCRAIVLTNGDLVALQTLDNMQSPVCRTGAPFRGAGGPMV